MHHIRHIIAITLAIFLFMAPLTTSTTPLTDKHDLLTQQDSVLCSNGIDSQCINHLISKALGVAIIAGAFFLKVPQILNMVKAQTSEGVVLSSLYLEIASYGAMAAYNILIQTPLTTYAESLVVTVQNLIIVAICWRYLNTNMSHRIAFVVTGAVFVGSMLILPPPSWPILMALSTILAMSSRISQIIANCRNGNTGVLSLTTCLLQCAGNLARVFTTLQEVDDVSILASYLISLFLNLTVLFQIFYYWNASDASRADNTTIDSDKKNS